VTELGLKVATIGSLLSTVNVAEAESVPFEAVITVELVEASALLVILNVPVLENGLTFTKLGIIADVAELDTVIGRVRPAEPACPLSVTVPTLLWPPTIVEGLSVIVIALAGNI
jgi:hypothetical protein